MFANPLKELPEPGYCEATRARKPATAERNRNSLDLGPGFERAPSVSREATRAALLFGERIVQPNGHVLLILTRLACERMKLMLGFDRPDDVFRLHGSFILTRASGEVISAGRRVRKQEAHTVSILDSQRRAAARAL